MKEIPKIELNNIEKEIDYSNIWNNAFVDVYKELERPPVAISIGEVQYKGSFYPVQFASYGDYSCIVGGSKTRKSFFKSALMASFIGGNTDSYFNNIKGYRRKDDVIIDIDTEQSKYHSQLVFKRVCEMVGANYELYFPFSLRNYTAKERQGFIDWIFNESEYRNNIGLMSIDGYADLVSDFNNLEQTNELTEKLLSWSGKHNCHITGILHTNFGSRKPVGHLGSTVLKKAETIAFLEKDEQNNTKVVCEYSRNKSFDEFEFEVDEYSWLPKLVRKNYKSIF